MPAPVLDAGGFQGKWGRDNEAIDLLGPAFVAAVAFPIFGVILAAALAVFFADLRVQRPEIVEHSNPQQARRQHLPDAHQAYEQHVLHAHPQRLPQQQRGPACWLFRNTGPASSDATTCTRCTTARPTTCTSR